ncbi:MAG: TonB-dependent receptor [Bacteroidales bacterium]|nr:MAG: TonB-dependent receptor [Bacteroidales bacterium]
MRYYKYVFFIPVILFELINHSNAQYTQTIKGRVVDLNTGIPLTGANVILLDTVELTGTVTDGEGNFHMVNVPVGRQGLKVSFIGYNTAIIRNLYVLSGKELVLDIKLEEKVFQGQDIIIKARSRKDRPLNEMAQISARSFTIEETERYAGSVGDPSRMAASFAGVLTLGSQINDIVIRGNSTNGLLWRMEGLKIPNPNHFGDLSSSGGTMSMLNNNTLANSDFYTGAFPAEFGDALSGVFDLKMRKGNYEKREYLAQIGLNGIEFGAEGPFSRGSKASYVANYRYGTMGIFELLGLNIGIFTIPVYQDFSFNINFPVKSTGRFSIFGVGGKNSLNGEEIDENEIDITQLKSSTGFIGCNHLHFFSDNSSISSSIGVSSTSNRTLIDNRENNIIDDYMWEKNKESTVEFLVEYKNRINSRNYLKAGFDYFYSSISLRDSIYLEDYGIYMRKLDVEGSVPLVRSYGQWKHRFNDQLSCVSGINYQYSKYGDDHSIEPRFSINWDFMPKQSVSMGMGIHTRLQPKFVYHYEILTDTLNKIYTKPNKDLRMTRSTHLVLGYNYLFNSNHRLKVEGYYQYLNRIPVEEESSHESLINYGSSFSDYDYKGLINKGTGYNYGTEITLEKFLSKNYYYLFTLSLFDSKYKGSDGILRNTRYNASIICNLLGGYEWHLRNRSTLGVDGRIIWAGGERKIPLDYEASEGKREAVYIISRAYEERFKDYFRFDIRVSYKINKKTSHTLAIDIMNVTNRNNHFIAVYDEDINDYDEVSTLGIIPALLWRWNF